MSWLLFLAGLILLLAGGSWFSGAHTVGVILTVAGGFWVIIGLLFFVFAAWAATKKF